MKFYCMLLQPVWSLVSPAIVILCLDKHVHDWQHKMGKKKESSLTTSVAVLPHSNAFIVPRLCHFLITNLLCLHSTATYYVLGVIDAMNGGVTRHLSHKMGWDKIMSPRGWDEINGFCKEKCFGPTSAGQHLSCLTSHESLQILRQKIL